MTIVDAHLHVHKPGEPLPDHELFEGYEAPAEDLIEDHQQHGIEGAVLVPMNANEANLEYADNAVEHYPGDAAVIGVYDGSVEDPADHYRGLCEEYDHLRGLRVSAPDVDPDANPRETDLWPLLETFDDRDHCLWIYPAVDQYGLVDRIAAELPELNVVYNLLGFPHPGGLEHFHLDDDGLPRNTNYLMPEDFPEDAREQLLESGERANTYVLWGTHWQYTDETYPYSGLADHGQDLYDSFGADHMAFIADWPWMQDVPGYNDLLEMVDDHLPELSDEERADVMGGTARRLFDW